MPLVDAVVCKRIYIFEEEQNKTVEDSRDKIYGQYLLNRGGSIHQMNYLEEDAVEHPCHLSHGDDGENPAHDFARQGAKQRFDHHRRP